MIKLKTWLWVLLGCLLFRVLIGLQPGWMDVVYRGGLFVPVRWLLDKTFGILPFPGVFLLVFLLLWPFVKPYFFPKMRKKNRGKIGTRLAKFAIQLVCAFLLLWGMNYGASDLQTMWEKDMQVSVSENPSSQDITVSDLETRYARELKACNQLRKSFDNFSPYVGDKEHSAIQFQLKNELDSRDHANFGEPNCRLIFADSGWLRKLGIQGIYNPYTGEGYVDASLLFIQQSFTYAHEMAHGFGVTTEGDCNYWAYAALTKSNDPKLRYAGHFVAMRHLHWALMREQAEMDEEKWYTQYSSQVMQDLEDLRENSRKFTTAIPELSEATNDAYLKLNGNEAGVASYDDLVKWMIFLE